MNNIKETYRKSVPLLIALCIGLNVGAFAQQAQSDYQIQQEFKEKYKAINSALEQAQEAEGVQKLIEEIKNLEEKYQQHEKLLDQALYPQTFAAEISQLKKHAVATKQRLTTIEKQDSTLIQLNDRLATYDTQLENLNSTTDSLRNAMQKSIKSEEQLSDLVRQYRESLEKRDDLILSFVDSVMVAYRQLDVKSMQDLENSKKQARFDSEGNALEMIESIANENIAFLKSNPKLATVEYLRMNAVQQEFEDMWNKLGGKLVDIYAEADDTEIKQQLDAAISEWNQQIAGKTWSSLNQAFKEKGINMPEFTDSKTFYSTLGNYVDESIQSSDNGSDKGYANYQNFNSFWSDTLKLEWSSFLNEGDILSHKQMASIDQKLDQWATKAEPKSNLLLYLLGASVIAIVVLGILLAREKSNKNIA